LDNDLSSIQEARDLAAQAHTAWRSWRTATQVQVDRVCAAMAEAGFHAAARLGQLAQEETGFGVAAHKRLKNEFASRGVWESIQPLRTVGIIRNDPSRHLYEIAWSLGVIAALTPSTNPTSTAIFKSLIAVKARNAIVIAPHPSAARCTYQAVQALAVAAENAGAPKGLISCMQQISLPGTQALLSHRRTALILATGGAAMVRAAHSTGKPAYGVGPGNVPAYVDRSANLERAARYIVASKAFDYSTICASEQAIVADKPIARRLAELLRQEGAYFTGEQETAALRRLLFHPDGSMNTAVVAKSAPFVADAAGFAVPEGTRVLVTPLAQVGAAEPLSHEKLTTVLGWYEAEGWEQGCEISLALIEAGGLGHTQIIHAEDGRVVLNFALEKPVFRILANTMGTLGALGLTTGLMPSLTLGSGGVGGSITGDNVTATHLLNIKRLAYEMSSPPPEALTEGQLPGANAAGAPATAPSPEALEQLVRSIVQQILQAG